MTTAQAHAVTTILGHEAICTLRIALRRAAYYDVIGDRHAFATLYHQLGGEAELTNREEEEKAQADLPAMPALPYEDPVCPRPKADFFSSSAERDSFIA
jgi:hypothetical protein